MFKVYSKESLIEAIKQIFNSGWQKSVKQTPTTKNDGAVGNTLEVLLDIPENNLPIPNAAEWELKGQRAHTSSLVTLKHIEPSPQAVSFVSNIFLPLYGWPHKEAGIKYPANEMSFRSTTSATGFTKRGFKVVVDNQEKKVKFIFDAKKVDTLDPEINAWLQMVNRKVGLGSLNPEPYWGFSDLMFGVGSKIKNCFYVIADTKKIDGHEYFKYKDLYILSGFSFDKFINCIESGIIDIDFDARTGHNHGTKFRIKQGHWTDLYTDVNHVIKSSFF